VKSTNICTNGIPSQASGQASANQPTEDDIKLNNRTMVLNFGEKQEEEETENLSKQWMPSSGSGNSTPHG